MQIVRYQKVGKDKYKIFLDNKETITLYENVILANNLLLNKEIDKEKLDILVKQNDIEDLYSKVLSYIAYRIRSVKEVRGYLVKKGANEYLTDYIIDKLKKTGYLNDDLFCKYYILDKINLTLDGPFKMRKYLQDNDISNETIDKYLNSYEDNFKERIDKLINKYLKLNNKLCGNALKTKIYNNLVNLGYDKNMILSLINNYDFNNNSNAKKIYDDLYKKYSSKYEGYELDMVIKQKMYQKGYNVNEINM